jgi:hypothetical protein
MGREAAPKGAVIRAYPHPPHTATEPKAPHRPLPPQAAPQSLTPVSRVEELPQERDSKEPYNPSMDGSWTSQLG